MTFTAFESLVKTYCPKVYRVTQKSQTQDGGVMVTYAEHGKAYIYKGSYFEILNKLGLNYICDTAVSQYKKMIDGELNNNSGFYGLLCKGDEAKKKHQERAESLQKELDSYIGYVLLTESGKVLGTYEG